MGSPLEHPEGAPGPNDLARRGELPPASPKTSAAAATTGRQDWRASQVREWLLLLLRFAITLDPDDQAAALRTAGEIELAGRSARATGAELLSQDYRRSLRGDQRA